MLGNDPLRSRIDVAVKAAKAGDSDEVGPEPIGRQLETSGRRSAKLGHYYEVHRACSNHEER